MSDTFIVCSACGGVNRLPPARNALQARCGTCKEKLFSGHAADVDATVFDCQVGRSTIPVLVDVWAPWCGPCRAMAPAYEAAAAQLEPHMRLIKLNSDAQPAISTRLGIRSIPTMILYQGGQERARTSGAMSARQIVDWVHGVMPSVAA